MRLIFAGTPTTAVAVADALSRSHEIVAVLTRPPAPQGRSATPVASPVEDWARGHGIEVLAPASLREAEFVARVREIQPHCCPVVAFGGLITRSLLAIPAFGWINLHYSLLPAYRGAAPVQRALLDGCVETGVTVFRIVRMLDAGPVFIRRGLPVGPEETAGDLLKRLTGLGSEAMLDALALMEAGSDPVAQDTHGVSLAPKVSVDEAQVDLAASSTDLVNLVRAMSPDPGAWTNLGSRRLKILRARVAGNPPADQGEIPSGRLLTTKKNLFCRAGDGWVELVEVQEQGKKTMAGAEWARGALKPGDSLG